MQGDGVAQLLEGLANGVIQLDLVLDVGRRLADFTDEFSESGRQLGQLLGTEKDQGQKQDDRDLTHAEIEHDLVFNSDPHKRTTRR